ncbi:MAG TPA: hypothetical protein VK745_30695 [Polyangiaceae bacterium]|nr:hypothetical protein [Polyangiaceae bacterium]
MPALVAPEDVQVWRYSSKGWKNPPCSGSFRVVGVVPVLPLLPLAEIEVTRACDARLHEAFGQSPCCAGSAGSRRQNLLAYADWNRFQPRSSSSSQLKGSRLHSPR